MFKCSACNQMYLNEFHKLRIINVLWPTKFSYKQKFKLKSFWIIIMAKYET